MIESVWTEFCCDVPSKKDKDLFIVILSMKHKEKFFKVFRIVTKKFASVSSSAFSIQVFKSNSALVHLKNRPRWNTLPKKRKKKGTL